MLWSTSPWMQASEKGCECGLGALSLAMVKFCGKGVHGWNEELGINTPSRVGSQCLSAHVGWGSQHSSHYTGSGSHGQEPPTPRTGAKSPHSRGH